MSTSAIRFLGQWRRAEVLEFLAKAPQRRFSLNGIARESGIPVATVWNAVRDLRQVGYVRVDRIGGTFAVSLNHASPAAKAFCGLVLETPHEMAYGTFRRRLQREVPGLRTKLFGSVSRGEESPASDVDVQVAYGGTGLGREAVLDLCAKASDEVLETFGITVQALVLPEFVVMR